MPTDAETLIPTMKARGITRSFGDDEESKIYALRNVSLELYPGQIALLMGPSGSGKSTLLAVLSGLLHPDCGSVRALDEDLWAMTERERESFRLQHFGFIFQGYNLFPALTAREQLEMILRWGAGASYQEAHDKTDEMLAMLGLSNRAHLRPLQLSGGEKQRVAIGRALIKQPGFVFADEPTAALDWKHGQHVIELLRAAAHDQNATILVVAHDSRIIPFVDRVLHLDDGVLFEGSEKPAEMYHDSSVASDF
ncbi:MAG: ABC transporter ATP-binding protein [Planctomycetes bacterium]|nr:ABC transporter ATP-binding protein [Planctomycetota bacterium]